jgi:hypothetical protein
VAAGETAWKVAGEAVEASEVSGRMDGEDECEDPLKLVEYVGIGAILLGAGMVDGVCTALGAFVCTFAFELLPVVLIGAESWLLLCCVTVAAVGSGSPERGAAIFDPVTGTVLATLYEGRDDGNRVESGWRGTGHKRVSAGKIQVWVREVPVTGPNKSSTESAGRACNWPEGSDVIATGTTQNRVMWSQRLDSAAKSRHRFWIAAATSFLKVQTSENGCKCTVTL